LDLLSKTIPDAIVLELKKEILNICKAFGKSGQSGGSAPYTAYAISKTIEELLLFRTLSPLTGEDDEWCDITEINNNEPMFQNVRDSRVFKYGKESKSEFIDAIVFTDDYDHSFTGFIELEDGTKIKSSKNIKSFPFTPKIFYLDVIEHDNKYKLKDKSQLTEILKYYE
jgi:hypothetical protein